MTETILVTGSSRGIGRAIALRVARAGYDLVLHCRARRDEADAVREAVQALGQNARILQFDIADRAACAAALEADVAAHSAYYGVVCNAGLTRDGAFPALTGDDWDSVLRTNLDGFYNVLHPLIMPMIRRRAPGRIVCITSVSGIIGNRGQVNYSASKAGVIGAAKALAVELAKRQITVNCVAPGLIDTDMLDPEVPVDDILKMIPAQRTGTPEEVAAAVQFLLSPDAGYITRQVLAVNGGLCWHPRTTRFPPNNKESDLTSLQDDAKRAGADAVTDILSNYINVEFRDTRNYECHKCFLVSGVAFKGKFIKAHP